MEKKDGELTNLQNSVDYEWKKRTGASHHCSNH